MELKPNAIYDYMIGQFREYYDLSAEFNLLDYFYQFETASIGNFEKAVLNPEPVWIEWKNLQIPVFLHSETPDNQLKLNFDPFMNGFLFLSGIQEHIIDKRDSHDRFPLSELLQYRFNIHRLPVVNIYFELLSEHLNKSGIQIKQKHLAGDKKSQILITHDIDRLNTGWKEMIGTGLRSGSFTGIYQIFKALSRKLFGKHDFYTEAIYNLMNFERQKNIKALYFFLNNTTKVDSDYEISSKKLHNIYSLLLENQSEIGLHSGYYTFRDQDEFKNHLNLLMKTCPGTSKINRQHFLRFDIRQTPYIYENLNIDYDYSLGFPEDYGFRNGICCPFKLYDFINQKAFSCTEIPLFFMDNAILYHKDTFDSKQFLELIDWINTHFSFQYSVLFHNTVFVKLKYHDAAPLFYSIIEYAEKHGLINKTI